MTSPGVVRVLRGDVVESSHQVHVVAIQRDRRRVAIGEAERWTYYRSASKPFQALALVEDRVLEAFGLGSEELALACASHSSEAEHLRLARGMLEAIGVGEDELACGGHWPLRESAAIRFLEEGRVPGPVDSNCSGKHAGMLGLARVHGWGVEGYERPEHPVQERMRQITSAWTGMQSSRLREGVDGCGVVCFAVPLARMAGSFAQLAQEARAGGAAAEVCRAMMQHPFLVAGTDRLCTDLMAAAPGIVAKVGAEGVYGVAIPEEGLGLAIKVEDGGWRAVDAALASVLSRMGLLTEAAGRELRGYLEPAVRNTRGEVVGSLEVEWPDRVFGASS
jgi:L-asparaginase II